jgi:hypothetical protein
MRPRPSVRGATQAPQQHHGNDHSERREALGYAPVEANPLRGCKQLAV